jgi:hypothetical protein
MRASQPCGLIEEQSDQQQPTTTKEAGNLAEQMKGRGEQK